MNGKECFEKIGVAFTRLFMLISMGKKYSKDFPCDYTINTCEVGSVTDNVVSLSTATAVENTIGCEPTKHDIVILTVSDVEGNKKDAHLSKQDCIQLMAYLSTATLLLRD